MNKPTAPRTMILLDPDLASDPTPKRPARDDAKLRLPSARTLSRFQREARAAVKLRGDVTVLLTSDTEIRKLNRQFRKKNKATDVLSFPASDAVSTEVAGDLAISIPTARRQAAEQGHSLSTEIKILMLHGMLHLAGYDHEVDSGEMARREHMLRRKLGLPEGLIERQLQPAGARGKSPRGIGSSRTKGAVR